MERESKSKTEAALALIVRKLQRTAKGRDISREKMLFSHSCAEYNLTFTYSEPKKIVGKITYTTLISEQQVQCG